MKIFLRTGAWYSSETPALTDDLELSSLLTNQPAIPKDTVVCNCKSEIAALNERIDILTKSINKPAETVAADNEPAKTPAKKSVTTAKKK